MIHLRNGRAQRHPQTLGNGKTWCGKRLLGTPKVEALVETYSSYGSDVRATLDPDAGTCPHCRTAFDAAYAEAFPSGPEPIAIFNLEDPADMARAARVLSPEAMNRFFGPRGDGIEAFVAALQDGNGGAG